MENPIKVDDLGVPLFSETSRKFFKKNNAHKFPSSGFCGLNEASKDFRKQFLPRKKPSDTLHLVVL